MYKVAANPIPDDVDGSVQARMRDLAVAGPGGCWLWVGTLDRDGYGYTSVRGRKYFAHRLAYAYWVATIPPGMVVDHLCRTRNCIRPEHLDAVSNAENLRRGKPQTQTHCKYGHEFTAENTYLLRGTSRMCKACSRRRVQESRQRRRASVT